MFVVNDCVAAAGALVKGREKVWMGTAGRLKVVLVKKCKM
jgi:hypothetical protein